MSNECPICLDNIEDICNKVITECGHIFHCSCLMKNVSHNGFKCPCCRSKMTDESDDESDDEDFEERIGFDENVLTSFRMFHQQINGEEVEETEEEQEEPEEPEEPEEQEEPTPDATYTSQKLIERGITFEDLVKNILYQEHNNDEYELRAAEVYGQFRAVISQFTRRAIRIASTPPLIPIPISYPQIIHVDEHEPGIHHIYIGNIPLRYKLILEPISEPKFQYDLCEQDCISDI
jgi:hypothetical protein